MEEVIKFSFSPSVKELFKALIKAKKKIGKIPLNAENPAFKVAGKVSKYADLGSVIEETDPKLLEEDLALTLWPTGDNYMTAFFVHAESGEWVTATFKLNIEPSYDKEKDLQGTVIFRTESYMDSQAWGAAVTYARRVATGAILTLAVDKDNDGSKLSGKPEDGSNDNNKLPWLNPNDENWESAKQFLKDGNPAQKLYEKYQLTKSTKQKLMTEADV